MLIASLTLILIPYSVLVSRKIKRHRRRQQLSRAAACGGDNSSDSDEPQSSLNNMGIGDRMVLAAFIIYSHLHSHILITLTLPLTLPLTHHLLISLHNTYNAKQSPVIYYLTSLQHQHPRLEVWVRLLRNVSRIHLFRLETPTDDIITPRLTNSDFEDYGWPLDMIF